MRAVICLSLMALFLLCSMLTCGIEIDTAQAYEEVSGRISSDTTWTKATSPYKLVGNTLVEKGVTLTIEAGTTVTRSSSYIMVEGTLIVKGTAQEQVQLGEVIFADSSVDWNEQTNTGSIIDNAFIDRTSISIRNAAPKITNTKFDRGSIVVENGSPIISNNNFLPGQITVNGGTPIITSNFIRAGYIIETTGFQSYHYDTAVFSFIAISITGGSPIVSNNTIRDGSTGIDIERGNPYISDNTITFCDIGIIANAGTIERNNFESIAQIGNAVVKNNTIGIEVLENSSPTLKYNNISYFRLSSSTNVDATNNWWTTTDTAEIDRIIWDYNDDFDLGKVNYTPFLTENPQTMPDPNAPIPTISDISASSTPESSSEIEDLFGFSWERTALIVLAVAVAVLALAVVALWRKVAT